VKDLVQNYQRKTQNHARLDTIEDMQRFMDNYPEFRQLSGTVSKHVAIMTELSRQVETRHLLNVSELEQELAVNQDHSGAMDKLLNMMENPKVDWDDKLRLVCLYALRYELQKHQLPQFKRLLRDKAMSDISKLQRIGVIDELLSYAGANKRGGDLFSNKTFLAMAGNWMKSGLKGAENIYTQHKPLLNETLTLLAQNKLKNNTHPYLDSNAAMSNSNSKTNKYRLVFVYIVGGLTYEEVFAVDQINNSSAGIKVILGGSYIHKSQSYLDDVISTRVSSGTHDQTIDLQ
jgi:vacuolar protein sorting-associated protein 45